MTTELKGLSVGLSGCVPEPADLADLGWGEQDIRALVSTVVDAILDQEGQIVHDANPTFLEVFRTVAEARWGQSPRPGAKPVRLLVCGPTLTQAEFAAIEEVHGFYAQVDRLGPCRESEWSAEQAAKQEAESVQTVRETMVKATDALVRVGGKDGTRRSSGSANPDDTDLATLARKAVYFAACFGRYSALANGLNSSENLRLAGETNPYIAAMLILRGLRAFQGARMENKRKHLDMIQAVVTRLAGNSFLLKGWSVTLVSALFAFAAKDSKPAFAFLAFVPVIVFWLLDGYFLSQERTFRAIFDVVRQKTESDIDFSMSPAQLNADPPSWGGALFSKTVVLFHGMLIAAIVAVMIALPRLAAP